MPYGGGADERRCVAIIQAGMAIADPQAVEFRFEVNGVDPARPLIYRWLIVDEAGDRIACYVGKSKNGAKRPMRDYERNVRRLMAGRPYRKGKPDGFREIHRLMAEAVRQKQTIVLTLLRNVPPDEDINVAEQELRREHGAM